MSRFFSAFGTAFIAIGFLCAPAAALVTFVVYVFITNGKQGALSIGIGLISALPIGIGVWAVYEKLYQSADAVNPEQYWNLKDRLMTDENRINKAPVVPASAPALVLAAEDNATELRDQISQLLNRHGPEWISADGYLEAWSKVYRLEEAMTLFLPPEYALAIGHDDLLRLKGSAIPNEADLTETLKMATTNLVKSLAPRAKSQLGKDEVSARTDISRVRHSINQYREEQWSGLVAERNRTMLTAAAAGLFAYLGLVSVVHWPMDPRALQVAMAFVITGALISLLHQATIVGSTESGIEDFGQSTSRLLSATFVSGVIALLGVIILEGAGIAINGSSLVSSFASWTDTFNWTTNRSGFFWAAVFGLAPSLLFKLLQDRSNQILGKLGSSQATGKTS
jgi:hypothetical protein